MLTPPDPPHARRTLRRAVAILLGAMAVAGLTWFYVAAATEHARRVNTVKARGDQSGYLWDAQRVYRNFRGYRPPFLIGERNRMPLYAGYLALFYRRGMTDPDYFEVAKRANIYLSVGLLALLAAVLRRQLPPVPAVNVVGVLAFGCFIFKAGYSQSELLFYTLFLFTFIACWHLFSARGRRALWLAALAGALAGVSHLTKAAMPPYVAIFAAVYLLASLVEADVRRSWADRWRLLAQRTVAITVFALVFLAVLSPYLLTSKRVFGQYFYNVNSTFYVWYDNWAQASLGTYAHGDGEGWPRLPDDQLPSAARYWRTHTLAQIGDRLAGGFRDMAEKSYSMFNYLHYVVLFSAATLVVCVSRPREVGALVARHAGLAAFLAAYGAAYLLLVAFYHPTSGTGTARFLLAHLAPLLFAISRFLTSPSISRTRWSIAGRELSPAHVHAAVALVLAFDVAFRVWPRLMSTYGGF